MPYAAVAVLLVIACLVLLKAHPLGVTSPSFAMCASFSLAFLMAFLGRGSWNTSQLTANALLLIFIGIMSFVISSLAVSASGSPTAPNKEIPARYSLRYCREPGVVFIAICTIFGLVVSRAVYTAGRALLQGTYLESEGDNSPLGAYKLANDAGLTAGQSLPFTTFQGMKVSYIISLICLFQITKSAVRPGVHLKGSAFIIPLATNILPWLVLGSRTEPMHILIAAFPFAVYCRRAQAEAVSARRFWIYLTSLLAAIPIGFLGVLNLLSGKTNPMSESEYLTFYFGAGIPSLSTVATNVNPTFRVKETFLGMQQTLQTMGLRESVDTTTSADWVSFGRFQSNVFTFVRRPYFDYGIVGVIVCAALMGIFCGLIYRMVETRKATNTDFDIRYVILLGMFYYLPVESVREDFFMLTLGSNLVMYIVFLFVLVWLTYRPIRVESHNTDVDVIGFHTA